MKSTMYAPLINAVQIPRASIRPDPNQPRQTFDPVELANLSESIREKGIKQPLLVRHEPSTYDGTPFVIVAGERRWRASENILEVLPCIIEDASADEAWELSVLENVQRRDLSAMEEAEAVRLIMEKHGFTISQTARRFNKSDGWVNNRIAFLKTKPDVKAAGERIAKAMSSLLMVNQLGNQDTRAAIIEAIETQEIPHVEVRARVTAAKAAEESAKAAAEFAARSQRPPDSHTAGRSAAFSKGKTSSVSRGKRVTGTDRREANSEVKKSISNITAWAHHCDEKTFDELREFARSVLRGNLSR